MTRRVLLAVLIIILAPVLVLAIDVSITAIVSPPIPPDTVVIFRGLAYPSSPITVRRQGVIAATVPADPQARFDIQLTGQPTGIITYSLQAEAANGQNSRVLNFTLSITQGVTTTITGIFLSPTIEADQTVIGLSDTILFSGYTAPNGEITLFISSPAEAPLGIDTADSTGLWTELLLGTEPGLGTHNARVRAVAPTSEISEFSDSLAFTVTDDSDPCDGFNKADINCDGFVNLTDFSILLFYWNQTNPANARADINDDNIVDLTDFSILLFNWTG